MTVTSNQTIQTQFRTIDDLSIRFAESERAGDDALLLNPWPESLYAFEPTWSRLAAIAHLVAIDLIDAAHFIWEDAADQYASIVLSWWGGGYALV
jgi:hypothetical protein